MVSGSRQRKRWNICWLGGTATIASFALPSSRLLGGYWKVVNKTPDAVIVVLSDTPENILKRITFYDIDSRPLYKRLTDDEKLLYLREIEGENSYYKPSFRRAHVSVISPAAARTMRRANPMVDHGRQVDAAA